MTDKITSSTMIPISVIVVVAGAVFWLSTIFVNLQSAEADILTVKRRQEEYRNLLLINQQSIDRRLSKMEGKIDYIHRYNLYDALKQRGSVKSLGGVDPFEDK